MVDPVALTEINQEVLLARLQAFRKRVSQKVLNFGAAP
jgi:hypothetical protein